MFLNKRVWFIALSILVVLLAATLQNEHVFGISGIRPNLVLVVLIVLCFFTNDLGLFCLLILLACIGIRFAPGISREALALTLVSLAAFFVKERAVWPGVFATAILLLLGTFCMYAFIQPQFIYQDFGSVVFESVYNIVLGFVLFEIVSLYVKKTRLTI